MIISLFWKILTPAEVERKRSMKLDVRSSVLSEDSDQEEEEEVWEKTTSPRQEVIRGSGDQETVRIHHSKSLGSLEKQDSFSKLLDSFGRIM